MSKKILVGAALVAVAVLGFAWFNMGGSAVQNQTVVDTTTTTQTGTTAATTTNTGPASTTNTPTSYTLAQIATHNNASSCWAAINGKVYNLTAWINQHPGGPERILSICGTDGSAAFNGQHGGQSQPANELTNFYIGTLAQ